ncbi:MAG: hypothetical protein K9K63_14215 [Desulfotignum sp.]|nr:hypothetical protein [Desulfotignum sp.]MCF8138454.1 hypothetical protein [Desulfotignum sp.]
MITLTLNMSESLLSILRDAGRPGQPTRRIRVHPGTPVRQILIDQNISPLLVPLIFLDSRKVSVDTPLEVDGVLTLHGPLAGG